MELINVYILLVILAFSLFFDLTRKKIPNFLTFPAILLGLGLNTVFGGLEGFLFSFFGFGLGLLIFIIPFAMGGMGGGDVKLMGAIGALMGTQFIIQSAVFTAIVGGIMAIIYMITSGQFFRMFNKMLGFVFAPLFTSLYIRSGVYLFSRISLYFSSVRDKEREKSTPVYMPYGVAIALGTLVVLSGLGNMIFPIGGGVLF